MAPKRAAPIASTSGSKAKKFKKEEEEEEGGGEAGISGIAVEEGDTPLVKLYAAMEDAAKVKALPAGKGGVVVYWMRSVLPFHAKSDYSIRKQRDTLRSDGVLRHSDMVSVIDC